MNKIAFGILTIAFNSYGVPCFIQGNVKAGILRIVLACVTFGVIGCINMVFGIIDGIKVLTMSEDDYKAAYGTLGRGIPGMNKKAE